jgi:hypothetical protein
VNWLTSTIKCFFFPIFWSRRGDAHHKIDLAFSDEFFFEELSKINFPNISKVTTFLQNFLKKSSHFLSEGFVKILRICNKIFQFCFFWFVILQTFGEVGGRGVGFLLFTWSSQWVLDMFLKFPMCSSTCSR